MKTKTANGTPLTVVDKKQEANTSTAVIPAPANTPAPAELLKGTPPEVLIPLAGSIDERLEKIGKLSALVARRKGIVSGVTRLAEFDFGHDQNTCRLSFTDAKGCAFESGNIETIKAVLALLTSRAKEELKKCEAEICEITL